MSNLVIKEATCYADAIIISDQIAAIWGDNIDNFYYDKMFKYMSSFNDGYIIGLLNGKPVASSIAFPIETIPGFDEINAGNIFDLIAENANYYYIHIVQVIEEYRNKGFGIKLLRYQINTAIKHRYREIVGMAIDRELALWRKCGFQDFGEYGFYKNYGRMKWVRMII